MRYQGASPAAIEVAVTLAMEVSEKKGHYFLPNTRARAVELASMQIGPHQVIDAIVEVIENGRVDRAGDDPCDPWGESGVYYRGGM